MTTIFIIAILDIAFVAKVQERPAPHAALGARRLRRRVRPGGADLLLAKQMGSTRNGAAAEVVNFVSLGKNIRPATFWKIHVG